MASNQERLASELHEFSIPPDRAAEIAAWIANVKPPILMPDLPTDDTVGMGSGEWSAGFGYEDEEENTYQAHAYAWAPGKIGISSPHIMDTDDAEAVALVTLAAVRSDRAHHTEQEQSNG